MKKYKALVVIVIILNILFKIPSLLEPLSYGDECIYLALGRAFQKGAVFYRDIHDNKPPLLYFIAALANGKLAYFRLISIIWNSINIVLVAAVAKKIVKNKWSAPIAAFIFFIFTLLPEGRVANGEIFMIMPATLAILMTLKNKQENYWWFLIGLCFSIAFLFKVPIAFDFAGFILAVFFFSKPDFSPIQNIKGIFSAFKNKRFYLVIAGFLFPILLSILYYSQKGAFTPYVRSALMQNIGYLSSWTGKNTGLYERAAIVALMSLFIFSWRKKLSFAFYLPALMTVFGLFGVFLSERPYPHYLIEIAPWAVILLTVLLFQKKLKQLIISLLIIFLTIAGIIKFKFWWYEFFPYYYNFIEFSLGKKNKTEYFRYFGNKVLEDYQLAGFIKEKTKPSDRIFIWGDGACSYVLSDRLPSGRYTVNYHIFDFNGFNETIRDIKTHSTPMIIALKSEARNFPQLENLLKENYVLVQNFKFAKVYKFINQNQWLK